MVYDDRDLMTYRQDGERKAENKWYAITYDSYGQIEQEGFAPNTSSAIDELLIDNTWGTTGVEKGKLIGTDKTILNDEANTTITQSYEYDNAGRLVVTRSNSILHPAEGSIVDSLILDDADNVVESYQKIIPDQIEIRRRFTYDHIGRPDESFIQMTTPDPTQPNGLMQWPEQEVAQLTFNAKELLVNLNLGDGLQNVSYDYLSNRLLNHINNAYNGLQDGDLWESTYEYNDDGTINSYIWKDIVGQSNRSYIYNYDFLKRLTAANYLGLGGSGTYSTTYDYEDHRGNFSSITRKSQGQQIDNLSYSYATGTNQVETIIDNATGPVSDGYKGYSSAHFTFNSNGSMLNDAGRNTTFERNHLNLPKSISVPDSNGIVMNYYDATGTLQRQEEVRNGAVVKIRDYISGVEYINGAIDIVHHNHGYIGFDRGLTEEHLDLIGSETVNATYESISTISERTISSPLDVDYKAQEMIILTPGFVVDLGADFTALIQNYPIQSLAARYYITDHLGQVNLEFKDNGRGTAVATSTYNYYPYGMLMDGPWTAQNEESNNNYLRLGGERTKLFDLGYDLHAFRNYDPANPGWTSPDMLSDHPYQVNKSPYQALWNNPVSFNDPEGNCPDCKTVDGGMLPNITISASRTGSSFHDQGAQRYGYNGSFADYQRQYGFEGVSYQNVNNYWNQAHSSDYEKYVASEDKAEAARIAVERMMMFAQYYALIGTVLAPSGGVGNGGVSGIGLRTRSFNFTSPITATPKPVHGNSLSSQRPTWFYELHHNNGTFLKNGITSKAIPETRYTRSFMLNKHMRNKIQFPNRRSAYDFEYQRNLINQGPLNKNMH